MNNFIIKLKRNIIALFLLVLSILYFSKILNVIGRGGTKLVTDNDFLIAGYIHFFLALIAFVVTEIMYKKKV